MEPQDISRIEGLWVGRWECERTGTKGSLRCRLSHLVGRHFRAEFKARYWFLLRYSRNIRITFRPEGEIFRCTGSQDLGKWAGGRYQYSGTIEGDCFQAMFASRTYRGEFRLERVGGDQGAAEGVDLP